ncbi:hypothetical protein M9H77_30487 [Catharanthus roseus]|uniref:Uncharacterized protein n=1 Tax=Catharanthus roseus TaxID=4058 RepID=A0ACB9ZZ87_CATRO|nr:hypothetical protein M9H77_30487 [Catharanthus roseus]
MRVSSTVEKSERIKTHQRCFHARNFKRTCNATMGLHGQSPDPQNEAIETNFRHLVVNTSQTPYERSITKQSYSHITCQNRLQIPGAPTRSALGPTSVLSPS